MGGGIKFCKNFFHLLSLSPFPIGGYLDVCELMPRKPKKESLMLRKRKVRLFPFSFGLTTALGMYRVLWSLSTVTTTSPFTVVTTSPFTFVTITFTVVTTRPVDGYVFLWFHAVPKARLQSLQESYSWSWTPLHSQRFFASFGSHHISLLCDVISLVN